MTAKEKKKKNANAPSIQNRKARHEYFVEEEIEAGIALLGTEVKSLRAGRANIGEAYAAEKDGELWLINAYIAEYEGGNRFNHATKRPRKLLLKKREIAKLIGKVKIKGYTLVPLSLYFSRSGYAKVKLGLGKGKTLYDKRETEKKRDWERQKAALMKKG